MSNNPNQLSAAACRLLLSYAALLIIAPLASGQPMPSNYQLKKVRIALLDGTLLSGKLLDLTPDSVILEDKSRVPVGSEIYIKPRHSAQGVWGYVVEISDSQLTLADKEGNHVKRVSRNEIDDLRIRSSPLSESNLILHQRKSIAATTVHYIALHKKGAGLLGAVAGAAAGAGIFYAIASSDSPSTTPSGLTAQIVADGTGEAVLGGLLGLPIGAAIGTRNKKHRIDGDLVKYQEFVRRVKISKRPSDP